MNSGVISGLPRVVPATGATIDGSKVPGGVSSSFLMLARILRLEADCCSKRPSYLSAVPLYITTRQSSLNPGRSSQNGGWYRTPKSSNNGWFHSRADHGNVWVLILLGWNYVLPWLLFSDALTSRLMREVRKNWLLESASYQSIKVGMYLLESRLQHSRSHRCRILAGIVPKQTELGLESPLNVLRI